MQWLNKIIQFEIPLEFPDELDLNDIGINGGKLSPDELKTLFHIMFREFMRDSALSVDTALDKSDWENISVSGNRRLYSKNPSEIKELIAWLPEPEKTNRRVKMLMKFLGITKEESFELLSLLWETFTDKADEYLEKIRFNSYSKKINGFGLNCKKIAVRKAEKLYICSECKKITPYSFRGYCENPSCCGNLIPYDAFSSKRSKHYRDLYTKIEITPMSIVEHTAQLSAQTASEYQRDFIKKKLQYHEQAFPYTFFAKYDIIK